MFGCDHPDVDSAKLGSCSPETYVANLAHVLQSANDAEYKRRRLETGISKPSIFLGFPSHRIFVLPKCFSSDIMHLASLNLPDLLIPLWRGRFDCDVDDYVSTWDWAVLKGRLEGAWQGSDGLLRPLICPHHSTDRLATQLKRSTADTRLGKSHFTSSAWDQHYSMAFF